MRMNPTIPTLQYHISDINNYVDSLTECNILVSVLLASSEL